MQHSFLILAYGESPYLADCIESLLRQTVKSKLVLCTGTPNDFIASIAKRYDLPLMVNPDHRSIAGDWNFAAACADTPYFTLAHQDDIYYPDYVSTLLPKMQDAVIGFTDYEELTPAGRRRPTLMLLIKRILLLPATVKKQLVSTGAKKSILRFGSPICCPSVMYNRARLQGFAFDESYRVSLDWEAWLRMTSISGSFCYANRVLMAHRIHPDSETTRQIAASGRSREDALLMARLWPSFLARPLARLYGHSTASNRVKP